MLSVGNVSPVEGIRVTAIGVTAIGVTAVRVTTIGVTAMGVTAIGVKLEDFEDILRVIAIRVLKWLIAIRPNSRAYFKLSSKTGL
jgi:hypothetical protein